MDDNESNPEDRRRAKWYVIAALAIMLIPIITGIVLANTGGDDEESSGMAGMGTDSSNEVSGETRSLDEILASGPEVEVDLSGTSAVLRLDTTIPVACSVVFGPTANFGGLATDTDMAGGGHTSHSPLMAGLEPGTTVLYRVQGTAADGTIYVGEIEQFTTPAGDGSAARTNLALDGSVVETSSEFNENFAGRMAIDGSLGTEWSSRGDGDAAYIVIDLGAVQTVTGFGFRTREMTDGTSITNTYTVTVDDGETLGPFEAGIGLSVADVAVSGRVFRFDMEDTTGGNTGAVEIEIYGG